MQRLRAAENGRQRLIGGADNVVVRVLLLQRDAGCLAMGSKHQRGCLLRFELFHDPRPKQARGTKLCRFHEEIHADGEKEGQASGEIIDIQPLGECRPHIFATIGQREGQFLHQRRAGLLHVIAGDRDGIEARHFLGGIFDDVGNDPHRGFGRVDIGVADHELLEDVVLDGPGKLGFRTALFFAGDDERGQDRDDRAVHCHRHRHVFQRNAVEQDLHILDTVDRHARLTDIALDARMIRIVTAMGGKVEGDGKPLLTGGEIATVECVGGFGGGKAGILADRPGSSGIHGGARSAHEWFDTRHRIEVSDALKILRRVERLDVDPFRRMPGQRLGRCLQFLFGKRFPIVSIGLLMRLRAVIRHRFPPEHAVSFTRVLETPW
ncbi:hypothetical protein D3C71_1241250 [compost metagenome]